MIVHDLDLWLTALGSTPRELAESLERLGFVGRAGVDNALTWYLRHQANMAYGSPCGVAVAPCGRNISLEYRENGRMHYKDRTDLLFPFFVMLREGKFPKLYRYV